MSYESRYQKLNVAQKAAVDTIDGPLMVIAGPGTGKTELLSMRAATILKQTDTLPQNILCLTFTESGANAMRKRLHDIIGSDAYKVAIHTFHSFGSDIIGRYGEYFYNGAAFSPASDGVIYDILEEIFESLDHANPLSSRMNDEFTYLRDAMSIISELKRNSLTSDELLSILADDERILDSCEREFSRIFADRITKTTTLVSLSEVAQQVALIERRILPPTVTPLANVLALDLSHAVDAATNDNSTKPLTAWRNKWFEKNSDNEFIFKDRKRMTRLRALAAIYYQYQRELQSRELYDYDDMILNVVHALEVNNDLRFNLQEQYLYIMVDEFQDTNLAQIRMLQNLTNSPSNEGAPNLMIVGDDDQAIYSFQGAEISNIEQFSMRYETLTRIVLTENYRSSQRILDSARSVITKAENRLETHGSFDINKSLLAKNEPKQTSVALHIAEDTSDERYWIAKEIRKRLDAGEQASEIAVLARRHSELLDLLPFLQSEGIVVNYERRENILENDIVAQLELLSRILVYLSRGDIASANARLPELLAHPAWQITPSQLWQLSLDATKARISWLEAMERSEDEALHTIHRWLTTQASACLITPLEAMIDTIMSTTDTTPGYMQYYFSDEMRETSPEKYVAFIDALRTIRDNVRTYTSSKQPKLSDLLEFIDTQRQLGSPLLSIKQPNTSDRVHLMTAHKAKGLEFDTVYVMGSVDSAWGQRVRVRSRLISYPENLPFAPAGDTYDERLRLYFVAMTRARQTLILTASKNDSSKSLERASFLDEINNVAPISHDAQHESTISKVAWYTPLLPNTDDDTLKTLLEPTLASYKLSATHFNAYLDVAGDGAAMFILNQLLRFPKAMSPSAAYGSAIHKALQIAHIHMQAKDVQLPVEDVLQSFEASLSTFSLNERDHEHFLRRGSDQLAVFLDQMYDSFSSSQWAEVNFSSQHVMLEDTAHLTGALDLMEVDEVAKTITVVDYKTGKPSLSWKGKTEFEKIKLHRYRQQLYFYKLLVEHSRDYAGYTVTHGRLQFVEPTADGIVVSLELEFEPEEVQRTTSLILAVWKNIQSLTMPETDAFSPDYAGILDFEASLLTDS